MPSMERTIFESILPNKQTIISIYCSFNRGEKNIIEGKNKRKMRHHKFLVMALSSKKAADFLRSYIFRQNWSLPSDSIIYYILKNPSTSKVYEKLIQSCKYFFIKNPILIISSLPPDYEDGWRIRIGQKVVNLDNTSSKIWITNEISNFRNNNAFSSLIPKLYKSDAKEIKLWSHNISFNDLKFIASKCESIWFDNVSVINDNGSILPCEKIIDVLPNVKDFHYRIPINSSHIITPKTVKELMRMPRFSIIRRLKLYEIPEIFDIECFYGYIKKNKKTKIWFNFSKLISNQYKNCLQTIVNEILETKNHNYKVPYIYFSGMNESSKRKLWNLFSSS